MQALLQIGPVSEITNHAAEVGPPLPQPERHRKIDAQRPVGGIAEGGSDAIAVGHHAL